MIHVNLPEATVSAKKISIYMEIAYTIAKLSKDAQTKVGAVLISPTGKIISTGYNGFVRGALDYKLPNTRPEKYQYMIHAEQNILYNCLDEGIKTKDCLLICTLSPCEACTRAIFQSGIKNVVYDKYYFTDSEFYSKMEDIDIRVNVYFDESFTHLELRSKTHQGYRK